MAASTIAARRVGPFDNLLVRLPRQPAEGWLALVATAAMAVAYAWSLQDAGWIPGPSGDTNYLAWLALAGVGVGFVGAKVGWGRWRTHLVGAALAGLLLPLIMGGLVLWSSNLGWDPAALPRRLAASLHVVQLVWRDLVIEGRPVTSQITHFHLVFGAMVWGAGQLAGFTVFGHRRPLDAVVVVGLLLLGNMAITTRGDGQLPILVVFSGAALLLLIRSHVFDEQLAWSRRRIGDPKVVGELYMRGGAAFVAIAIAGSMLLTATASSAPLQDLWADVPQRLVALTEWLQRIAPPGAPWRDPGVISFGQTATTQGVWNPSQTEAFRAQFGPTESRVVKWRVGTYAVYNNYGWEWGPTREENTAARDPVLGRYVNGDAPNIIGRRDMRAQITPEGFRDAIVSPQTVRSVDIPTIARSIGEDGFFTTVIPAGERAAYNLIAWIPVFQDVQGGITEARLRVAGDEYPDELVRLYTQLPPDAIDDPRTQALLADIRAAVNPPADVPAHNAYDLARTMEGYLQSEANFDYQTDVRDVSRVACDGLSTVECFAVIKQGYCEYYASTMAVLLRASGVPARIAYGFLPGERDTTGLEIVGGWGMHWWVEVFFPGTGWVEFDPTGGGVGQVQPIPSGSVGVPTARPSVPIPTERDVPVATPGGGPFPPTGPGSTIGPFIAITLILGIGFAALAFAALKRTPRNPMHPDSAWGSLARWASRLGLGPRPSQTVYEYAGALGDELPAARVELTTLARAKVEVAYGRRDLGQDRLRRIAEAWQRLRFALVSFAIRRLLRRGRRR